MSPKCLAQGLTRTGHQELGARVGMEVPAKGLDG